MTVCEIGVEAIVGGMRDFQSLTVATAGYSRPQSFGWLFPILGLSGAVGVVQNVLKRTLKDLGGVMTSEVQAKVKQELGDALWHLARVAAECDLDLGEIAVEDIERRSKRQHR